MKKERLLQEKYLILEGFKFIKYFGTFEILKNYRKELKFKIIKRRTSDQDCFI